MKIDIQLVKSREMFCKESAMATIARWKNRNYEMMFLKTIGFDFDYEKACEENIIGRNIYCGYDNKDIIESFEKYHGIKVENKEFFDNPVSSIKELLNKSMPITLFIPDSYCSWIGDFGKDTFIMIVGYENDVFHCIDIHLGSADIYSLKFEYIDRLYQNDNKISYQTYTIVANEDKNISINNLIYSIKNSKYYLNSEEIIYKMHKLADFIESRLDLEIEMKVETINYFVPIRLNLSHILRSRLLIGKLLDYVYKVTKDDMAKKLSSEFTILGLEWEKAVFLLDKLLYSKRISNKPIERYNEICSKIATRLRKVMNEEHQFIQKLCRNELIEMDEYIVHNVECCQSFEEIVECDISSYFDTRAFALTLENIEHADISGYNEYFVSGCLNNEINVNVFGHNFSLCPNSLGYDNMLCKNQEIKIKSDRYTKMVIIGCAVWGDGSGIISIKSNNGEKKVHMRISDWYNILEDNIVWCGNAVDIMGNIGQRAVSMYIYSLNNNDMLDSLLLPDTTNVYIFKILFFK